jgi:hypothetical protein
VKQESAKELSVSMRFRPKVQALLWRPSDEHSLSDNQSANSGTMRVHI